MVSEGSNDEPLNLVATAAAASQRRRAGPAVAEAHDVHGGLVPPVEHQHHQHVPQLVTGAQVVELACRGRQRKGLRMLNTVCVYVCMRVRVRA